MAGGSRGRVELLCAAGSGRARQSSTNSPCSGGVRHAYCSYRTAPRLKRLLANNHSGTDLLLGTHGAAVTPQHRAEGAARVAAAQAQD